MNRLRFQNQNIEKLIKLGYWEWWPFINEVTFSSGFLNAFQFINKKITPPSLIKYFRSNLNRNDYHELIGYLQNLKNGINDEQTKIFALPVANEIKYFEFNALLTENNQVKCIAGTIQEVTEKIKYSKLKEKELLFEKKVANMASRFLNEKKFELAISETLSELGQLCAANRVSLIRIYHDKITLEYNWKSDNQKEGCIFSPTIKTEEAKFFIDLLKEQKNLFYHSIKELPERLSEIKTNAINLNIESVIISSIQKDNKTIGALILGKKSKHSKWDFSDIHMAKLTSIVLSNAIKQNILHKSILESEKRLKFALLAGNLGTYEYNLAINQRIFDEKSANIFGYSCHTINKINKWFENNLHEDYTDIYDNCLTQCLEGNKKYYEIEYKIKCLDGSYKWINDWGIVTETNNDGEPIHIVGVIQDSTHRKNIEEALIFAKEKAEENENLKSAFLANVSHEIRTPMNGITGFAELLYHDMVSDQEKNKYLEIIYKNSNRLLNLINNILDISKLDTLQLKLFERPCSLKELLNDINIKLKSLLEHRPLVKFNIETDLNPDDFMFIVDDSRLKQVLVNLIENAVKFTPKGFINVIIEHNNTDEIIFSVKDNGMGISEKFQKKIFNRFSQSDFTIKQNIGGTGLGLPISKGLVEMMGGSIWMNSVKGVGSTFSFSIPYKKGEVQITN